MPIGTPFFLSDQQSVEAIRLWENNLTLSDISCRFGVSISVIGKIGLINKD